LSHGTNWVNCEKLIIPYYSIGYDVIGRATCGFRLYLQESQSRENYSLTFPMGINGCIQVKCCSGTMAASTGG